MGEGGGPNFTFSQAYHLQKGLETRILVRTGGGGRGEGEIASLGGAPRLFKGTKLISLAENSFKIENLDSFRIPRWLRGGGVGWK